MEFAPISQFRTLWQDVKDRVPSYDEFPDRISEDEARQFLQQMRERVADVHLSKQAFSLNIQQMACLVRVLTGGVRVIALFPSFG